MKPGLPKKWTHVEFCELLVYDLIFGRKLSILDGMTVSSSSAHTLDGSLATYAEGEREYDLTGNKGIGIYLEENSATWPVSTRVLTGRMAGLSSIASGGSRKSG